MSIELSATLQLPLDAVTQTFGFLARKGAGKTYAASKMAEGMLAAGAQIIALDPVGNWYGLRLSASGKPSNLPIYIFGGANADVPLDPASARDLAKVLASEPISAILDVSEMRKAERQRFAAQFAEEFYHLKKTRRTPVHLFLEEAQLFVPQNVAGDSAAMVGAFEDIVRLGRNYGIGTSMISQRPQAVNKQVLSQVECLVVLQTNGTHDVALTFESDVELRTIWFARGSHIDVVPGHTVMVMRPGHCDAPICDACCREVALGRNYCRAHWSAHERQGEFDQSLEVAECS